MGIHFQEAVRILYYIDIILLHNIIIIFLKFAFRIVSKGQKRGTENI